MENGGLQMLLSAWGAPRNGSAPCLDTHNQHVCMHFHEPIDIYGQGHTPFGILTCHDKEVVRVLFSIPTFFFPFPFTSQHF